MKKLFFGIFASLFLFAMTAFANEELTVDYSQMTGGAKKISVPEDYVPEIPDDIPVFYSDLTGDLSEEEYIFQTLDAYLSPENIVDEDIRKAKAVDENGVFVGMLYIIDVPVIVSLNSSDYLMGIYNKYVEKNPEKFYLITEKFGLNFVNENGMYKTSIPAIIGGDFDGFNGGKEDLEILRTRYYELEEKIEEIVQSLTFEGMTDLDKLLLVHDYIADNCAYYKTSTGYMGDGYSHNAYGVLINKFAVCQGYTYAYTAILKKFGFPLENLRCITSDDMDHIWNFVKLGNYWYNIDVTWDDPTNPQYNMYDKSQQRVKHSYFLISDETNAELRSSDYPEFDQFLWGYNDNISELSTDKSYESGYIFNDFHIGANKQVGKISYSNGNYIVNTQKNYIVGMDFNFYFDTLKSPKYVVSQPYVLENNETEDSDIDELLGSDVLILNCTETEETTDVTFYYCFYDENMRFISAQSDNVQIRDLSLYTIRYQAPSNAKTFKLICVSRNNFIPIANAPIIK